MICTNCGQSLGGQESFCPACGQSVARPAPRTPWLAVTLAVLVVLGLTVAVIVVGRMAFQDRRAAQDDEPRERLPGFGEYVYVEELPEATVKVPPEYPDFARTAGVEGTVMVQALVGRDGLVKDTRVLNSIPMLDAAAVVAVRRWRFRPAMAKGQRVAVWVAIPVKFTLE